VGVVFLDLVKALASDAPEEPNAGNYMVQREIDALYNLAKAMLNMKAGRTPLMQYWAQWNYVRESDPEANYGGLMVWWFTRLKRVHLG
jgi:hypothetical protein